MRARKSDHPHAVYFQRLYPSELWRAEHFLKSLCFGFLFVADMADLIVLPSKYTMKASFMPCRMAAAPIASNFVFPSSMMDRTFPQWATYGISMFKDV